MSIEDCKEKSIIRISDKGAEKVLYLEVHSQEFECNEEHELTPKLAKEVAQSPHLSRYLLRRKYLFSKFDEGIAYDEESLYSIIPQNVSLYLKSRLWQSGVRKVCEPFCGVGGIAVHLCDKF